MNLESIKALATSKVARQVLQTQKHSPKILFIAGAVGVVGATVLACRSTLKLSDVLTEAEEASAKAVSLHEKVQGSAYDDQALSKDLTKIKVKTTLEIVKLYAPAVGVMVVSVGALTGSHIILSKRNGALMATYAGLQKAYDEYRQRIANEYGVDIDRKFATGTGDLVVEEKTSDGKTKTHVVQTKDGRFGGSPYAALFDESSHKFTREPGKNAMIVGMQQSYANDKLRANGHLFLNEAYDMLGLPRTPAGAVVGWVYRNDSEEKNGDNYVSFGIFDGDIERAEAFVDGDEESVWLDFNVDGVIYNLI